MWFKNIQVYRFTKEMEWDSEALEQSLEEHTFVPCGSQDVAKMGWVSPISDDSPSLVHSANGFIMLCAKRQDKVLPAAVVNEAVEEKVKEISEQESRRVSRKERQEIKEELTFTLLSRAFTRSSRLFAYIDTRAGLLVVNAGSAKKADDFCGMLRDTLGSLPVLPMACRHMPEQMMTQWLSESSQPEGFEFGTECELVDQGEDGGLIRCKNQLLTGTDILNHLKSGMTVSKLHLISENGIEFIVDDKLAVKRIRYGDMIQDKVNDVYTDDAAERFDVDFAIMTLELGELIKRLVGAMGGEQESDAAI